MTSSRRFREPGAVWSGGPLCASVGRYPYLLFDTLRGDEIVILHVRHSARAPIDPSRL
ncbi:MAG: hypothetical protein WAN86_07870 [Hyphomicrobiaceae bacterium]